MLDVSALLPSLASPPLMLTTLRPLCKAEKVLYAVCDPRHCHHRPLGRQEACVPSSVRAREPWA
jgi:hypothetical protein